MIKINRKVEYALISLKFLSELVPGELASASDICERYEIPYDPTSRVLQLMTKAKLLRSEHGTQGGYQIVRDLSRVTILDLSEILVGKTAIARCITGKSCELMKKCNIVSPLTKLNVQFIDFIKQIDLKTLLESSLPISVQEVRHG